MTEDESPSKSSSEFESILEEKDLELLLSGSPLVFESAMLEDFKRARDGGFILMISIGQNERAQLAALIEKGDRPFNMVIVDKSI